MLTAPGFASVEADPLVTFCRFMPECRPPIRADRAAGGTLPTRAFRYCDPVTSASAFGWYLFPPIDFTVMWDGTGLIWTYRGKEDWYPLTSAQFPGFKKHFSETAPEQFAAFAPSFLTFDPHLHLLQIWSGYFARTKQNWSLLVRPTVNVSHGDCFRSYEAIIEIDRWFGPLFTNIQLTKRNTPIHFRRDFPYLQLQPLHRDIYSDATLNDFKVVPSVSALSQEDWARFEETVVEPNRLKPRPIGQYAVAARRRRKQNVAA
jgi:hypothetical protein